MNNKILLVNPLDINDKKHVFFVNDNFLKLKNNILIHKIVKSTYHNMNILRYSHYKNISNIRGSTRKIRAQKRLGRARQGAAREIHMRGGSVKFGFSGDKYRDKIKRYKSYHKINKKEKILCMKLILANKVKYNNCIIVELNQTTNICKFVNYKNFFINVYDKCCFFYDTFKEIIAIKNKKDFTFININTINAYYFLKKINVIFTKDAFIKFMLKLNMNFNIQSIK